MKAYENPQIKVVALSEKDMITTSLEAGIFDANDERSESFDKYFPS